MNREPERYRERPRINRHLDYVQEDYLSPPYGRNPTPYRNPQPQQRREQTFTPNRGIASELKQRIGSTGPVSEQNPHQKVRNWINNNDSNVPDIVVDEVRNEVSDKGMHSAQSYPSSAGERESSTHQSSAGKCPDTTLDDEFTSLDDDAETSKILDQNLWDRFQVVPRDNTDSDPGFKTLLQAIKLMAYGILFILVLGSAVVNKLSLLTMASGIIKAQQQGEANPTKLMLLIGLCFPYFCWFLAYSARSVFGNVGWPTFKTTLAVIVLESLHSVGMCLLLFRILPEVDMMRALLLMSSTFVIPSLCKTITSTVEQSNTRTRRCLSSLLSLIAFIIQVGSVVLCTLSGVTFSSDDRDILKGASKLPSNKDIIFRSSVKFWSKVSWEIPVSMVLISVMTWENYINHDASFLGLKLPFTTWKKNLHLLRQRLYIFVSVWKIGLSILLAIVFSDDFQFTLTYPSPVNSTATVQAEVLHFQQYGPMYANLLSSILCSYFGGLACKLCMQKFSFSIPLASATPLCVVVVLMQCRYEFVPFPGDTFIWVCPTEQDPWFLYHLALLGVAWVSQVIVTSHVWFPSSSRMAKIERLFLTPMRCTMLTDQFLLLRRRVDDRDRLLLNSLDSDSLIDDDQQKSDSVIPLIYACATMWHETTEEMTLLLKSIFRIDIDHSARYLAQKYYGIRDPDYYEFEAHILFDDAMELTEDDKMVPNQYVCDLISCVDEALSSVHERQLFLGPPSRVPTPYGGRLTWNLPGGTTLNVHLKDKMKIRHKKRWSQVMYMYYLLGYRILAEPDSSEENLSDVKAQVDKVRLTPSQLRRRRRCAHFTRSVIFNNVSEEVQTRAENTFILALDGDVDFRPDAVRLLVDRMRKNKKVGAACGRIHPTGNGPMIWYQAFEYAIGHWLQKSTEHVFGCVLCAPGCFTLFRGSALMDDNITRMYAKTSTQAGDYVQYDQGEDRWLSTLLIQQGYRIDYCAAADAFTHAPETFSEFFNQRRRWGPSTLANIIDLLRTWTTAVKINDNLSTPYIFYQVALLVSTILGPATVLLMMAGAYSVVFKTTVVESHILSIIPAICYIFVCIYTKSQTQLVVGAFLSAFYSIVMTVVLVGTARTSIDGSITSPNAVFLIMLVFMFMTAAMMHPEEFSCVLPGLLYFICIPASFLVLNIYFLCNLNVVSWGTREAPKKKTQEEIEQEKRDEEEKKNKKNEKSGFLGWLGLRQVISELGNVFNELRCMLYESFKLNETIQRKKTDQLLEELIVELRASRVGSVESMDGDSNVSTEQTSDTEVKSEIPFKGIPKPQQIAPVLALQAPDVPTWLQKEDPKHPGWLSCPLVGQGPVVRLSERENTFWSQLIKKYLHPIVDTKEHKEKMSNDLKSLRNNVVFGFFMVTSLWVVFFLQLEVLQNELKEFMFIKIPRLDPNAEPLTFQPFGLAFFAFFAVIAVFQYFGMVIHRWGTILHMLSITTISLGHNFTEKDKIKDIILKVANLQKMRDIEYEPDPDYNEPLPDYEGDDAGSVISTPDRPPPSYHTQDVPVGHHRRNSGIFNRQGQPTGTSLHSVFEKRFRNELGRVMHPRNPRNDFAVSMNGYPEPDMTHY